MADLDPHETSINVTEVQDTEEDNPLKMRKRKKTSPTWDSFQQLKNLFVTHRLNDLFVVLNIENFVVICKEVVPEGTKETCKLCKEKFFVKKGGPTTEILRHYNVKCPKRTNSDLKQSLLGLQQDFGNVSYITNFKYDYSKVRQAAAYMILAHEYPFNMMEHEFFNQYMLTATPYYQKISRNVVREDVMAVYNFEKKRLKYVLTRVSKVSITSDFWKSNQQIGYMCVTAHFINSDSDWSLQKRVLSFCDVPPPHTGLVISYTILECLMRWGIENKVSTVTFDNTSNKVSTWLNLLLE